jgi:hypothetical protein
LSAPRNRPKTKIEFEYKLLATSRTTTMEKEMNDASAKAIASSK